MSRAQPQLGSAALQNPATKRLNVTDSTCFQLSIFKDVIKEYRKLDDFVTMRMNRNGALFREVPLASGTTYPRSTYTRNNDESEACLYFWNQLVANWKSRSEIIDYCVKVVDRNLEQKESELTALVEARTSASNLSSPLFEPSRPEADYWRGPTNDFYRPVQHASGQSSAITSSIEGEGQPVADTREKYNEERRRKEKETDIRNLLWEERVKRDQIANEKTVEAIVRRRSYEAFRTRCQFFEPPSSDPWWEEVSKSRSFRP